MVFWLRCVYIEIKFVAMIFQKCKAHSYWVKGNWLSSRCVRHSPKSPLCSFLLWSTWGTESLTLPRPIWAFLSHRAGTSASSTCKCHVSTWRATSEKSAFLSSQESVDSRQLWSIYFFSAQMLCRKVERCTRALFRKLSHYPSRGHWLHRLSWLP